MDGLAQLRVQHLICHFLLPPHCEVCSTQKRSPPLSHKVSMWQGQDKNTEASMEASQPHTAIAASQIFYFSSMFISSTADCEEEKEAKKQR